MESCFYSARILSITSPISYLMDSFNFSERFVEFSSISSFTAFACYSIATLSILSRLFHPKGPNLIITLIFACLAIVFHVLSSSQFLFTHNHLNVSLPNVVSLVSLIISLVISLMITLIISLFISLTVT